MPLYFASDIHLRPDRPDRGERFARWLATLQPGVDDVCLVGDLCDFWFASRQQQGWDLPCAGLRALAGFTAQGGVLTILPGNHDAYASGTRHHFAEMWADYLRGDRAVSNVASFPYVRRRGPLALIGVSSAIPTAPFMATGWLGRAQRSALDRTLAQLADDDLFRVLLIHHPLHTTPGRWAARLRDAREVLDIVARHGVDLVLHGHDHRHATVWFDGPRGRIPAIGVPSSSVIAGSHQDPAAYNLFAIEREGTRWRVTQTVRGFARGDASRVREIGKRVLA